MKFPSALLAFQSRFPDEGACWAYLRRARWARGFRCPRRGHRRSYGLAERGLEQCVACRYEASLTPERSCTAVCSQN